VNLAASEALEMGKKDQAVTAIDRLISGFPWVAVTNNEHSAAPDSQLTCLLRRNRFSVPAAAPKKSRHRLHLLLHHRLVPSPPAGLAGVRRGGEPNLCVEVSVKVVFSSKLS
jgi:hypothetical protein